MTQPAHDHTGKSQELARTNQGIPQTTEDTPLVRYEADIEKIEGEFRTTALQLHASAVENEMLRESVISAVQKTRELEAAVAASTIQVQDWRGRSHEFERQLELAQRNIADLIRERESLLAQVERASRERDALSASVERLQMDLTSVPWRAVGVYRRARKLIPHRILSVGARMVDRREGSK